MKYICLLILVACNSSSDRKIVNKENHSSFIDSVSKVVDSFSVAVADFKEVADFAKDAQARIKELESKKQDAESQVKNEPVYMAMMRSDDYKPTDDKDKEIYRLTQKIKDYEREIAKLKNRLFYDSMNHVSQNYDVVPNEEKPNDKSLVITLDKKMRGDGEIAEQGVNVFIIPYNKGTKKEIKKSGVDEYEASCNYSALNKLKAQQANYYKGQYFFNDIPIGKYLIKVCALWGNAVVIERENKYQLVEIKMSPPIQ